MKTINLDEFGITIELTEDGGGIISSTLKDICPYCLNSCCDFDCENAFEWASDRDIDCQIDKNQELQDARIYNSRIDAIESMILAHAIAGVSVDSSAYIEGIQTAINACANNN
jgi:hypothetical protein